MNYEEAISEIQGNERFNVLALLTLSMMACISSMDINSIVFIGHTPSYKCVDPIFNQTQLTWTVKECQAIARSENGTNHTIYCRNWKYNKTDMTNTISTEFNLVCNKKKYVTLMNTMFFVGMSVGNFIAICGDKIGRMRLIHLAVIWEIIINICLPFATNIWLIILLRFLSGLGTGKIYQGLCYLTEIVSIKRRSLYTNNYWILYVLGYMLIPGLAYGTKDWRLSRHLMNFPLLFYLTYFLLPESPRWLGIGGKFKKAITNLLLIAKYNGKIFPENKFDSLIITKQKLGNITDIFGSKIMRLKMFVLIFVHGTISVSYFGLSINESFLSSNIFLNVFIQGLLETFTGPVAWIMSSKLNRRVSMLINFLICSVCLMLNNFYSFNNIIVSIVISTLGSIGKFALTTAYCICDMYLNEVFPTPIRNMSIFIILGIASIFTVFAPSINGIDEFIPYFSCSCYSVMCLISGLLIYFFLPETKGCPLPQTLEEGNELRKGNENNYCNMILKHDELYNCKTKL
uniref:Slc22a-5 n=1 Tax=Schmidtea mediterranea TaxID=79327 RepID=A0A0H3YK93_SCHMD|nr:slc22a-5 [Schmidtea mediterranea]